MFRKIVSNLSFSTSLVGQLGFYARRLRKEETTRRLGLIFVALALVVQVLAVFQAPESANAASSNDFVYGGLGVGPSLSINNFLRPYDSNTSHLKDIMNYMGITRNEIAATQYGQITVDWSSRMSWGHDPHFSAAQGEAPLTITGADGGQFTIYHRPLYRWYKQGVKIDAYIGHSTRVGWFALMTGCGNLVTNIVPEAPTPIPTPPPAPANIIESKSATNVTQNNVDASLTPAKAGDTINFTLTTKNTGGSVGAVAVKDDLTSVLKYARLSNSDGGSLNGSVLSWPQTNINPGATITHTFSVQVANSLPTTPNPCSISNTYGTSVGISIDCPKPPAQIVESKTAVNLTQGQVDAQTVTAKANDQIQFTLTAKNTGGSPKAVTISDPLQDTLEYAKILDAGGGTFDQTSKTLSWPAVNLDPGASQSRSFVVQMLPEIPAMAQGTSDTTSYDCTIVNVYGNDVTIKVDCPAPKVVEQTVDQLPHTGPTENMIFAGIVLAIVTYFYARSRQLNKEVRLIRRDFNAGLI